MFTTEFNGKQYVFDSDHLSVNGFPIPYREMSNIAHRGGDQPAFVFDFKGRRFMLPYNPGEMRSILPYFLYARQFSAAPAPQPEPEPAPEPVAEPEPIYEPEPVVEPEVEPVVEPEPDFFEAEAVAEPAPEPEIAPAPAKLPPEEPPVKKNRTVLKVVIGLLILAAIAAAVFFIFGNRSDSEESADAGDVSEEYVDDSFEEAEEEAPPAPNGGTFEATDGFTVKDSDGTMDIKLKKVYLGDDALKKIGDLGEDQKTYTEEAEPGYRFVLYEYEAAVKEGTMVGDTITGEMFMPDQKTTFDDWWPNDLVNNTDKDLSYGDIEVPAGKTETLYILYSMPEDIKETYEMVYADTEDTSIWVHYVLE